MQPVSQSLQEYPEMKPHYSRIHEMLAEGDETIQMLGRLGYASAKGPAPRWPLESFLRSAWWKWLLVRLGSHPVHRV